MPPGQRCGTCNKAGHNRVTCPVAREEREREIRTLRTRLDDALAVIRSLRRMVMEARRDRDRHRDDAAAAEHLAGWAEDRAREAEQRADAAVDEARARGNEADELASLLVERERRLREVEQELARLAPHLARLVKQRDDLAAQLSQSREEAARLGLAADVGESLVDGFAQQVAELTLALKDSRAEAAELRRILART